MEASRAEQCHQGLSHGAVVVFSIVFDVLKAAAIRLSTGHIRFRGTPPLPCLFGFTGDDASARLMIRGRHQAASSISTFSLFPFSLGLLRIFRRERNVLAVADYETTGYWCRALQGIAIEVMMMFHRAHS